MNTPRRGRPKNADVKLSPPTFTALCETFALWGKEMKSLDLGEYKTWEANKKFGGNNRRVQTLCSLAPLLDVLIDISRETNGLLDQKQLELAILASIGSLAPGTSKNSSYCEFTAVKIRAMLYHLNSLGKWERPYLIDGTSANTFYFLRIEIVFLCIL